jgi:hypothetical protein
MLIGLIFFVPVFGLAVGSAMGALSSKLTDYGINDAFIREVREQITEGTSALFLTTSGAVQDRVSAAFKGDGMKLIKSKRPLDRMQQRHTKIEAILLDARRDFGVGGLSLVFEIPMIVLAGKQPARTTVFEKSAQVVASTAAA